MFNNKQQEAIDSRDGRIRVIAGAGSGKTGVLTHRYAELIKSGINPNNILCVTFTNKAANEMKERIYKLVGTKTPLNLITTFHGFCLRLFRENAYLFGWDSKFNILDGEDQNAIIKQIYKELGITRDDLNYSTAKDIITDYKVNKEYYLLNVFTTDGSIKRLYTEAKKAYKQSLLHSDKLKEAVYFGYLFYQQKNMGIDFNDMIILACTILNQVPEVKEKWQKQLKYVMVDEFQDASKRQYELVSILSEKSNNLFVVGDPDQTIYTWRGAKPEILVNFDKDGKTKTIFMNQNYRSTPEILEVANTVIEPNQLRVAKDLFTENKNGDKVLWVHSDNQQKEASWICNKIRELLHTYKPKDIAILYRMHFLSRSVEEGLVKNKIPYVIHSGVNFYERKEIKDVLAYLRVLANPKDDLSLKRIINVPTRGIGNAKIQALQQYANDNNCSMWEACLHFSKSDKNEKVQNFVMLINYLAQKSLKLSIQDIIEEILDKSGYGKLLRESFEEERILNVRELISSISSFDKDITLDQYLQEIALLTNTDKKSRDCVTLMTVHSAKGLEFPVVFVIGMSEGYFPCTKSLDTTEQQEEERRLAYVAYTRAKEKLILTDSDGFDFNGRLRETSRFITEIDDLVETPKKNSLNIFKPKVFVVKKHKEEEEDKIYDSSVYNPNCDIVQATCYSAQRHVRDNYGSKHHGQYFQNGQYYDWDDDTYLQGSIDAEDIFDEGDFC